MDAVYSRFFSDGEYKMQGYTEIINQQQGEFTIAESTRVWLTNTYTDRHFSNYVKGSIKREIARRVIVNGLTGSSWFFKRFKDFHRIMSS